MKRILLAGLLLLREVGALAQSAPVITAQPLNQIAFIGGSASFSITPSGTGPFAYQWLFNGTNIPPIMTTAAGDGRRSPAGDGGPATNASLYGPSGVAVDRSGNLFIADHDNQLIRRVDTNGIISTVAGNGVPNFSGDGGAAIDASIDSPTSLAVDLRGNIYFADYGNNCIRRVGTNGIITTVAGIGTVNSFGGVFSGDGGPATNADLNFAFGIALDGLGNLFIADTDNSRVRGVNTNGVITTVAGNGATDFSGDGGAATNAGVNGPLGVGVDGGGTLYIADSHNQRIRRVGPDGTITTVAGGGAAGDGAAATNASLNSPVSISFDEFGSLYIADRYNHRVRKVGADGIMTTIAGTGTASYTGDGGAAANATLAYPSAVALNASGDVFIADRDNNRIREIVAQRSTYTLNGVTANDVGAYSVVVTSPFGTATSSVAALAIVSPPQPLSQKAPVGGTATFDVSVTGPRPCGGQWYFDGAALPGQTGETLTLANLQTSDAGAYTIVITNCSQGSVTSSPAMLAVGLPPVMSIQPTNQMVVAGSNVLFQASASGTGPFSYQWRLNGTNLPAIITTVAGNGTTAYSGDGGRATNAGLNYPVGVVIDGTGNLLVADFKNNRIRKIDPTGIITTVAGSGIPSFSGDGGPATNAALNGPTGVAWDNSGTLFIADTGNSRIRKVTTNGVISTIVGNGGRGYYGDGAKATNANLNLPGGILADGRGNLYIADTGNNAVRRVDTNGLITTVAANRLNLPPFGDSLGDGGPASRGNLNNPTSISRDSFGNLFIADSQDNVIRKVDTAGIITTVAGTGGLGFTSDGGAATEAQLAYPNGVAVDGLGNILIADTANNRLRKVDDHGIISTVAGFGPSYPGGGGYSGDGGDATTTALNYPSSVAMDNFGNLFFADSRNNRIREVVAPGPLLSLNQTGGGNAGNYELVVSSPFGSVTSSIVTLNVVLPSLRAAITSEGGLSLQLAGVAEQTYILQAATNLVTPVYWQPVYTNSADAGGNWTFTNSNLPMNPAVFYRVTVP